jgi:hypothetical protein
MSDVLDKRGVFWWFDETVGQTDSIEKSIPGTLRIGDEGQINLDLDGSLWYEDATEHLRLG